MCLRTTKQWWRWSLKEGVPQWDMFPGLTEWRLLIIRSNQFEPETPNQVHRPQKPTRIHSLAGHFLELHLSIFLLNRHHFTTANASTATNTTTKTAHTVTYWHMFLEPNTNILQTRHPFPSQTEAHFIPSGTRLAQFYQDSCFLHAANIIARQGLDQNTRTPTLSQVRAVSTRRADWTSDHCHWYWEQSGDTREGREKRTTEERRGKRRKETRRDRDEKRQRDREKDRQSTREEKAETPPCVVPSNVQSSHHEAVLYVFEDREAVIKMIIKGRSPIMRHVSGLHRVALNWLLDRINLDPKIQIKYIDTKSQLADFLTEGNFTRDEWYHLSCLFNISHFNPTVCSDTMAKRSQQDSEE